MINRKKNINDLEFKYPHDLILKWQWFTSVYWIFHKITPEHSTMFLCADLRA